MKTAAVSTFLALLLTTSTYALPSSSNNKTPKPAPKPTRYCITNYIEGCSPGGCIYNFDISYPGSPPPLNTPVLKTHCTGTNVSPGNALQACKNPSLLATSIPGSGDFTVKIEHVYTNPDNGAVYHVLGNKTLKYVGRGPYRFDIVPSEIWAVL